MEKIKCLFKVNIGVSEKTSWLAQLS